MKLVRLYPCSPVWRPVRGGLYCLRFAGTICQGGVFLRRTRQGGSNLCSRVVRRVERAQFWERVGSFAPLIISKSSIDMVSACDHDVRRVRPNYYIPLT